MHINRNNTIWSRLFDIFNVVFLVTASIAMTIPFLYIVGCSFATVGEIATRPFFLIPRTFQLEAYKYIFSSGTLPQALLNSVGVTLTGTVVSLICTLSFAYPLSKQDFAARKPLLTMVTITIVFSGGLIPSYLNVRNLNLLDSYWALILPGAISSWNLIVVKNFFQALPVELEESAKIEGATEIQVFFKIVLPLSMAAVSTFALFYAVGYWNDYRSALFYLPSANRKWTLQLILRNIVMMSSGNIDDANFDPNLVKPPTESVKNAVIVFATFPILLVYPFVQKHFIKGVMVGAIKG
jgi:putative aldouronate transport system permease protein